MHNVSFLEREEQRVDVDLGCAAIVHDNAGEKDLWNPMLSAWFPDGLDTPGIALIKVHADSAEDWDGPSSQVVALIGIIRAATRDSEKMIDAQNEFSLPGGRDFVGSRTPLRPADRAW